MIFTMPYGTVYCVRLYFYQIVLLHLTFVWFEAIKMLKSNCFIAFQQSFIFRFHFLVVINGQQIKWVQTIESNTFTDLKTNSETEKNKNRKHSLANSIEMFWLRFSSLRFTNMIRNWLQFGEMKCIFAPHCIISTSYTINMNSIEKDFLKLIHFSSKSATLFIVLSMERSFKFHFESVETIFYSFASRLIEIARP